MDENMKKELLRKIPYGVYVIGVKKGDVISAFTGTWASQVSFIPPLVMIGVRKDSKGWEYIQSSKVFSVNFLSKSQTDIAKTFFRPPEPKGMNLGGNNFITGDSGAPILEEALGFLDCKVVEIAGTGDHAIVVGEVIQAISKKEDTPLLLNDTPWNYGG